MPLVFPTSEEVPESRRHVDLRTLLYQSLRAAFGERAVLGSDQFVYWDPTDPKARCAPDVLARLGEPDAPFPSWKVWERGAPHLAVEFISEYDSWDGPWSKKLERYRKLGVRELVRFDMEDPGNELRIWDFVDGDLVERDPAAPGFRFSSVFGGYWFVKADEFGPTLRLARDEEGIVLYPTPDEGRLAAEAAARTAEEARLAAEEARRAAEEARRAAEVRIRELE
ncbi:MAG TPA: Uma2 family endonuclease, partial [Polyangiaceae bacterium]